MPRHKDSIANRDLAKRTHVVSDARWWKAAVRARQEDEEEAVEEADTALSTGSHCATPLETEEAAEAGSP
uniref:Uncharacterized protein n=1 Tax=Knipowitschia caucasica TaxID=637954 RepID=A0AAV2LGP1_KNICA